jgi:hypothetical protein
MSPRPVNLSNLRNITETLIMKVDMRETIAKEKRTMRTQEVDKELDANSNE